MSMGIVRKRYCGGRLAATTYVLIVMTIATLIARAASVRTRPAMRARPIRDYAPQNVDQTVGKMKKDKTVIDTTARSSVDELRFQEARAAQRADQEQWSWKKVTSKNNKSLGFTSREGHSAVALEHMIVIFGGCFLDKECFNDVTVFDSEKMQWLSSFAHGIKPSPREGHSACMIGTRMYVFGGSSTAGYMNDVHVLDMEPPWTTGEEIAFSWGQPSVGGEPPAAREGHTGTAVDGSVLVFGGYSEGGYRNELHMLDTDRMTWTAVETRGESPTGREGHTATLFKDQLVIFGGFTDRSSAGGDKSSSSNGGGRALNDLHVLDTRTMTWSSPAVKGTVPEARQDAAAVRFGAKLLLSGGCSFKSRVCFNDMYLFDVASKEWEKKQAVAERFSPREDHALTVVRDKVLLTGGCFLDRACFGGDEILELDSGGSWSCGGPSSDCSGNGFCRHGICLCMPGFAEHDCMSRMHCPNRCSGHGRCLNDGRCSCSIGFGGRDCNVPMPCPSGCSGRGECVQGRCRCVPGWSGESCDVCRVGSTAACNNKGACFKNTTAPARFASRPILNAPGSTGATSRFVSGGAALLASSRETAQVRAGDLASQQLYVAEVAQTPAYGCKCDSNWYGPTCTSNAEASPPPIEAPKDPTASLCKMPQFKDTKWCEPCAQALRTEMMATSDVELAKKIGKVSEKLTDSSSCDVKSIVASLKRGDEPETAAMSVRSSPSAVAAAPSYGNDAKPKTRVVKEAPTWWDDPPGRSEEAHVSGPHALRLKTRESSDVRTEKGVDASMSDAERSLVKALMQGVVVSPKHEDATSSPTPSPSSLGTTSEENSAVRGRSSDSLVIGKIEGEEEVESDDGSDGETSSEDPASPQPVSSSAGENVDIASSETENAGTIAAQVCPEACERDGHGFCSDGRCFCRPGYYTDDCSVAYPADETTHVHRFQVHLIVAACGLIVGAFAAILWRPMRDMCGLARTASTASFSKRSLNEPWVGFRS